MNPCAGVLAESRNPPGVCKPLDKGKHPLKRVHDSLRRVLAERGLQTASIMPSQKARGSGRGCNGTSSRK